MQCTTMTPNSERTAVGQQYLIGGVKVVTGKERLDLLASKPISSKKPPYQKPCDIGLFDEGKRNQIELF